MSWLDRSLGYPDYRWPSDSEYYEYPRNCVGTHELSSFSPSGSRWWERGQVESDFGSSRLLRDSSIFENPYAVEVYRDLYPNWDMSHPYRERGHLYEDEGNSRDTSRYISQHIGTTEFYNSESDRFRDFGLGRVAYDPTTYDDRKYWTVDYEDDYDARSEALARAMEESLILERNPASHGTPTDARSPHSIPASAKESGGMPTCAGCHRTFGSGKFLTCLNQDWHPSCFCCGYCHQPIVDKEFSVHEKDPYHRLCYKKLFHPKCEICYNYIPANGQGQIEYRSHPFWNQKYCPSHERDGSRCCCSCDRIEPVDQRYHKLPDGRRVCSQCLESSMMATKDCQPLYRDILRFYRDMGMSIEQEIPMLLVEREALNHARESEEGGHIHEPETRGLCLSEEQILPVLGRHGEMRQQTRHSEVTAILVLCGLPKLLTGSILAHELMHAWIRLDGRFPNLDNIIEEGICQVIAHIWLSSELESLTRRGGSPTSKRLGEFFLHQIETDSSPTYGDGFRAAYTAVTTYGLPRTLHHLRHTGEILQ